MTSAAPLRRYSGTRRWAQVYAYLTLRHGDRSVVEFGYAGQTRQRHRGRDSQHRDEQPWADLIVGDPIVIAVGEWTDGELDAVEQAAIAGDWAKVLALATGEVRRRTGRRDALPDTAGMRAVQACGMRPRYNIDHNMDNPDRVPPWTAQQQRQERDRQFGREPWMAPAPAPVRRPTPGVLRLTPWQLWLVAWAPLWCIAGVWTSSPVWGGVLSAGLLAWGVVRGRRGRR